MAYFDSGHGHALDSAPQDDYLSDNQNKLDEMQVTCLLLVFRVGFSFPAPPTFESKWSVLLSSLCLQKVHKCPLSGGSKALIFRLPLDSVHPMPLRFQPHNSKSPWPHLGVYSKSHLHTWFPIVTSWTETYHHKNDSPSIHVSKPWCGHALMVSINLSQH